MKELNISSEFIFPNKYGDSILQNNYWKHWKSYCKTNNITSTSPYELRHTFVSIVKTLLEGYLKQIVGHSKDMDTYGVYSHDAEGDKEKTSKLVEDIFTNIIE